MKREQSHIDGSYSMHVNNAKLIINLSRTSVMQEMQSTSESLITLTSTSVFMRLPWKNVDE